MYGHSTDNVVQHAIPASSIQSSIPKSTITKRQAKPKKGLGAKKVGGLAGVKVTKAEFEKLEQSVEKNDHIKPSLSSMSPESEMSISEQNKDSSQESTRLAFEESSLKKNQHNAKLDNMDENKREQALRLGMGKMDGTGISHTVDMITIDQVDPVKQPRKGRYNGYNNNFSSSFANTKRSNLRREAEPSDEEDTELMNRTDFSYSGEKKSSRVDGQQSYSFTPIGEGHHADVNLFRSSTSMELKSNRQRNVRKSSDSNVERDGFKNTKGTSSDTFFEADEDQVSKKERLRKYEGRTSISSDDFFGREPSKSSGGKQAVGIRSGMKEGVRSVAGKISNMASDIAFTLKDRYG